jgi:hypothetical protein
MYRSSPPYIDFKGYFLKKIRKQLKFLRHEELGAKRCKIPDLKHMILAYLNMGKSIINAFKTGDIPYFYLRAWTGDLHDGANEKLVWEENKVRDFVRHELLNGPVCLWRHCNLALEEGLRLIKEITRNESSPFVCEQAEGTLILINSPIGKKFIYKLCGRIETVSVDEIEGISEILAKPNIDYDDREKIAEQFKKYLNKKGGLIDLATERLMRMFDEVKTYAPIDEGRDTFRQLDSECGHKKPEDYDLYKKNVKELDRFFHKIEMWEKPRQSCSQFESTTPKP